MAGSPESRVALRREGSPPDPLPASRRTTLGWRPADLWALLKLTFARWNEDRIPKLAAALAYYTSFSIAPILIIAIAVASLVFGSDAARGAVSREISGLVGLRIGEGIESLLKSAWQPKAGLTATILGAIALVLGASGVFAELQDSLNVIWKVRKKERRGFWGVIRDRFLSFSMVLGIGFLLLVSLVLSAGLNAVGEAMAGWQGKGATIRLLGSAFSLLAITLLFAASFRILPDAVTRWRDIWVGALLTAGLFSLGKYLIGLYLGKSSLGSTYGAAGSFVLLLLWIYYSSQIFFFGAEFTKTWADTHGLAPKPRAGAIRTPERPAAVQELL